MSDAMFYGILRMPYELAMSDELSRSQFYSTAQAAATRVERLEAEIERLRGISNDLDQLRGSAYAYETSKPEQKAKIDALFLQMDEQLALRRIDRERRRAQVDFEGENKRVADRRHN
jgi:ribosomal protein S8E